MLANIVRFIKSIVFNANKDQMANQPQMWVSKEEWHEQGARALEKLGPR